MLRPRSIAALILVGLAITLAPLIAAVITAVLQVDRLSILGRDAVLEAEEITRQSREVHSSLNEMRRPYLQYLVTVDPDFYAIYLERRSDLQQALRSLGHRPLTDRGRQYLEDLSREEQELFVALGDPRAGEKPATTRAAVDQAWADVNYSARALLAESGALVDRQVTELTQRADRLQRALVVQAAAVLPATICLAALFFGLITSPMRQIGQAIRRLGAQELSQRISVRGPSDVQELGELLEWLRQRIQRLEQQKIAFLRHISHELKTPLTTIRAGSELLVEGFGESLGEEAELARIIHANGLQLQRLIEDLLRFSETQDVVTELELSESVDLASVVRGVTSAQSLASDARGIEVAADLAPVLVRGDENKLRIVIDNLLTNATKYTPSGGRISVSLRAAGSCAVLDVIDTGPGIDESETESIFEPFQQGSAECNASVKGTGLGLSIAKEYVEAHDGHIRVVGSTVGAHLRVSIPIAGPRGQRKVSRTMLGRRLLVGV